MNIYKVYDTHNDDKLVTEGVASQLKIDGKKISYTTLCFAVKKGNLVQHRYRVEIEKSVPYTKENMKACGIDCTPKKKKRKKEEKPMNILELINQKARDNGMSYGYWVLYCDTHPGTALY